MIAFRPKSEPPKAYCKDAWPHWPPKNRRSTRDFSGGPRFKQPNGANLVQSPTKLVKDKA